MFWYVNLIWESFSPKTNHLLENGGTHFPRNPYCPPREREVSSDTLQIILKAWPPEVLLTGGFMNHFETPALEGFPEKAAPKCEITI